MRYLLVYVSATVADPRSSYAILVPHGSPFYVIYARHIPTDFRLFRYRSALVGTPAGQARLREGIRPRHSRNPGSAPVLMDDSGLSAKTPYLGRVSEREPGSAAGTSAVTRRPAVAVVAAFLTGLAARTVGQD